MGDEVIEQKPRRTARRPDGTNEKNYTRCERWRPKRWAWEFLIRNENFVSDTKLASGQGEGEQRAVAEKYGLKRFKSASESYLGGSGAPLFIGATIHSWTNWDDALQKHSTRLVRRHQMVILFDLEQMMVDRASMRAQLLAAQRRIGKRLDELERQQNRKAAVHRPKWQVMTFNLRLLDLLDVAKKTTVESYLILDRVLREEFKTEPVDTRRRIHNMASDRIKRVRQIVEEDYRYIANMKTRKLD